MATRRKTPKKRRNAQLRQMLEERRNELRTGNCSECGGEIAEARLRALPFAIRCRQCEEAHERAPRASTSVEVQTSAATDFELACDRVVNGAEVQADGPAINGGVLPAREVEAEDDAAGDPDFEAEGAVESLSSPGDCATTACRSVTIRGLRFTVERFTRFREITGGCEGLAVGAQVRARGALANPPSSPVLPPRANEIERR